MHQFVGFFLTFQETKMKYRHVCTGILFICIVLTHAHAEEYVPKGTVYPYGMEDLVYRDTARSRNIPVRIYAPKPGIGGRFPVIVFSHGGGESREAFSYLGTCWAGNGYIAVFATHEGHDRKELERNVRRGVSMINASAGPEKFPERPADISFVLDRILSGSPGSRLVKGRACADRICAAGQCAGSSTALALAGLTAHMPAGKGISFRDSRFGLVIALSPQMHNSRSRYGLYPGSWDGIVTPVLVVTGTKDFTWAPAVRRNPDMRRISYDSMPAGDKFLVDIKGAEHHAFTDSDPCYPGGRRDPRHHTWIQQATLAYLDAFLKHNESAEKWLVNEKLEKKTAGECRQEYKPYDFSIVDAYIEKSLPGIGEGCVLTVIRGQRVIHRRAYGNFTLDRIVPIASATKWISGGVLMSLVDTHGISLDDAASKYLEEFRGDKADITIRQMFSHTHGFPDKPYLHRKKNITMKEAVARIADVPLAYKPGTALLYSGLGMQAAGRICEVAAGKKWAAIAEENIFRACDMKHTSYDAFGRTENPMVPGGIRTCAGDYTNYMMMLVNRGYFRGRRILSEQAVDAMLSVQSGHVRILRHPYAPFASVDPDAAKAPYGIGCWIHTYDRQTGRGMEMTSGGAFGCIPFLDFTRNVAGVYLPCSRNMKKNDSGLMYNEAAIAYFGIKERINMALGHVPKFSGKNEALHEAGIRREETKENQVISMDRSGFRGSSPGPCSVKTVQCVTLTSGSGKHPLQVLVSYPDKKGRYPLIVYSHYAGGSKDDYASLISRWSSYGYICLLPNHPDSPAMRSITGQRKRKHWRSRPEDTAFILDNLDQVVKQVPDLENRLDTERIGVGGHYIGSLAGAQLAGMKGFGPDSREEYRDRRVRAVLMMSPVGRGQGLDKTAWSGIDKPLMVITGSRDFSLRTGNDPEWRTEPFQFAPPGNKYLVWISGYTAANGKAGTAGSAWKDPFLTDIRISTLAFWDSYLKGKKEGFAFLNSGRMFRETGGRVRIRAKHQNPPDPQPDERAEPVGEPVSDISREYMEKAAGYSEKKNGRAVLVMQKGTIIFEEYQNGADRDTAVHIHSATKGFWSGGIAAMIHDGLISGYDEPAWKTLHEWKDDPVKSRITVRHLMSLSAGLVQDVSALQGFGGYAKDKYAYAAALDTDHAPGTGFRYGPSCYYALGALMQRKCEDRYKNPLDYLTKRILDRVGCRISDWKHDPSGNPHIPNGAFLTARDWIRYGQLLLQKGTWEGKEIIRKDLIEACAEPSQANPGHGLALWLNCTGGHGSHPSYHIAPPGSKGGWIYFGGHTDIIGLLGAGRCRMYLVPSENMVIVRMGEDEPRTGGYVDSHFLQLLFEGKAEQDGGSDNRLVQRIMRLDRNGDGKLSIDEIPEKYSGLRRAFRYLDADRDKMLSSEELAQIKKFKAARGR